MSSRRAWWILAAMVLSVPALWVGAHHLRPLPAPRFSASELPPALPAGQNGWRELPAIHELPEDVALDFVVPAEWESLGPEDGVDAELDDREPKVRRLLQSPDFRDAVAASRRALDAPNFRDAQPPGPMTNLLQLHWLHAFWDLALVDARDDPDEILRLASARLRADRDLLENGRSLTALWATLHDLKTTLALLAPLSRRMTPTQASALSRVVSELDLSAIPLRSRVIQDYLEMRETILNFPMGLSSRLLFDRAATMAHVDDYFEDLMRQVESSSAITVTMKSDTSFIPYNVSGRELLEMFPDEGRLFVQEEPLRAEAQAAQAYLLRWLRAPGRDGGQAAPPPGL
ncbi:MAG: hypothetical protein GXP55_13840 [Deltaproteobacteria bacterium]|nr:hypothetical protein [Deltaproteobacteria bacterium]